MKSEPPAVYFYPHSYFRDRQLDTIRHWKQSPVLNPEILEARLGQQASKEQSLSGSIKKVWQQRLPLINLKLRPAGLPSDAVVYVWGGLMATGSFIIDLDNPYAMTGYNLTAMKLYRSIISLFLLADRCREIRCMSGACRETLKLLFGDAVYQKANVCYPFMEAKVNSSPETNLKGCRFLFVGTQFEIKGGAALLRAFQKVYKKEPSARLDVVTHLPEKFQTLVESCPGIHVHEASLAREAVHERFMKNADVLVHPTYLDSFGMVVLEALAHGLAIIGTDVYAMREMVRDGENGALLQPPISIWDGAAPSRYAKDWFNFQSHLKGLNTRAFEEALQHALLALAENPKRTRVCKQNSFKLFRQNFESPRNN